ncbi:MAG: uroporphyrinogen decarboxylase [Planctomycetia bacterium]|nr:uroporphyrinogen decarboxylase [Planctomycetia bacterium]
MTKAGETKVQNSLLLKSLRGEAIDRYPVWLMRQAGRYMAEYRAVRERISFLDLCRNPELCAEVMQTAVEKIGVDAAIIFSDLLPILQPMGFDLEYRQGDGPVISNPFREEGDLTRVIELNDASPMSYVFETVRATCHAMPEIPVIGFAGAPFTLAGYAIEGRGGTSFHQTRALMYGRPDLWHEFMGRLTRTIALYVNEQIAAGAAVIQLFDSWVGVLGPQAFRDFVLPWCRELLRLITPGTPVIYFGTGNPELLNDFVATGAAGIGLDWRADLACACRTVPNSIAIQGNLDPAILLADEMTVRHETQALLRKVTRRTGYIFNLGHGVLKETPVENVQALVRTVKEVGREQCARLL